MQTINFETRVVRVARLVLIEWRDSVGDSGWQSFDSNDKDPMKILSVGYLIERTNEKTVLVPHLHMGEDDMPQGMSGRIVIPNIAIVRITELTEAKKEPSNVQA